MPVSLLYILQSCMVLFSVANMKLFEWSLGVEFMEINTQPLDRFLTSRIVHTNELMLGLNRPNVVLLWRLQPSIFFAKIERSFSATKIYLRDYNSIFNNFSYFHRYL